MKLSTKTDYRKRRHLRLRQRLRGTAARPRMSVFISNKHMYVQFINDDAASTVATASTQSADMKAAQPLKMNTESAKKLGQLAAKVAKSKGIEAVVFDRGGFAFRGRVKALADAARESGLKF
jgi:large subunit ribosomal protein L18